MRVISPQMEVHFAGGVTTLATCWKITREDTVELGFTDHDTDLIVGGLDYSSIAGFTPTTLENKSNMSVDNMEVEGQTFPSKITEADLLAGRYDYAEVEIFLVNFEDLTQGKMIMKRGRLGEVRLNKNFFTAEIRGLTARDSWLVDFNKSILQDKVELFCNIYETEKNRWVKAGKPKDIGKFITRSIKWTSELESHLKRGTSLQYDESYVADALYRPFVNRAMYYSEALTHRRYQMPTFFPNVNTENKVITFLSIISSWPLSTLATNRIFDYCLLKQGNGATQAIGYWIYGSDGKRQENITNWALDKFRKHYNNIKITKEDIFNYVYGILHDPLYREKYSLNLKREFPNIPLYKDFQKWVGWGKQLMELHIDYARIQPYDLQIIVLKDKKGQEINNPECKLKADKNAGCITIDSATMLSGIPKEAWNYKLGNRSAIEWILEQYKESKPKDKTVREKFNTYQFADYKENVIDLLMRVTRVSVETMKIIQEMKSINSN